ncbi:MAG: DUF4239 domain-containing protein [Candidatus Aenigmarchaeota archaeon]|nr:DUF4239 domain-containing protein [Candidatus Aenigmarchaeota archaeon]
MMQAKYAMFVATIIAFLLSFNTVRIFTLEEMSVFLTVIGLIYGIMAAFAISNAWERFSKIRDAIAEETNALTTMYIYAKHMTDKSAVRKLKEKTIEYCKEVPKVDWPDYWTSEKTHQKFRSLIETVAGMNLKGVKDVELFDDVSEELRTASTSRNLQLILSRTRLSKFQWMLNIFLSLILIIGLTFLRIPDYITAIVSSTLMIIAVIFILFVVYELDSLRVSDKEVSIEPWLKVAKFIEKN